MLTWCWLWCSSICKCINLHFHTICCVRVGYQVSSLTWPSLPGPPSPALSPRPLSPALSPQPSLPDNRSEWLRAGRVSSRSGVLSGGCGPARQWSSYFGVQVEGPGCRWKGRGAGEPCLVTLKSVCGNVFLVTSLLYLLAWDLRIMHCRTLCSYIIAVCLYDAPPQAH